MSNWCLGCHKVIPDGDYCEGCKYFTDLEERGICEDCGLKISNDCDCNYDSSQDNPDEDGIPF